MRPVFSLGRTPAPTSVQRGLVEVMVGWLQDGDRQIWSDPPEPGGDRQTGAAAADDEDFAVFATNCHVRLLCLQATKKRRERPSSRPG